MSPTELIALSKGRIPARIILSEIRTHLSVNEHNEHAVRVLAEKAQLSPDTIPTWLKYERVQSIAFDDADRLLCAMGRQYAWWGEYAQYYFGCDLSWTRCACPGCETMFRGSHAHEGPTVKRYCSKACQTAAAKLRDGVTTRRRKDYQRADVCRNDHPRTPENTKTRPSGRTECIICAREAARRCYERKMGRAA